MKQITISYEEFEHMQKRIEFLESGEELSLYKKENERLKKEGKKFAVSINCHTEFSPLGHHFRSYKYFSDIEEIKTFIEEKEKESKQEFHTLQNELFKAQIEHSKIMQRNLLQRILNSGVKI